MLEPVPLLTFSFLEWFKKQDTKNLNLVESIWKFYNLL